MRLAPMTLSKKRYDIEYASQYTDQELKKSIKQTLCLVIGACGLLIYFGLHSLWILGAIGVLAFGGGVLYLARLITLKKRKHVSFRYSLVAGDPVFIPIPEDDAPTSEPEKGSPPN
jgi:hypothetical protein